MADVTSIRRHSGSKSDHFPSTTVRNPRAQRLRTDSGKNVPKSSRFDDIHEDLVTGSSWNVHRPLRKGRAGFAIEPLNARGFSKAVQKVRNKSMEQGRNVLVMAAKVDETGPKCARNGRS